MTKKETNGDRWFVDTACIGTKAGTANSRENQIFIGTVRGTANSQSQPNFEKLYYVAPPQKQFDELKQKAIEAWLYIGYEETYSRKKQKQVHDISNVRDNFMYILGMFSSNNLRLISKALSQPTKKSIYDRLLSVNSPEALSFRPVEKVMELMN